MDSASRLRRIYSRSDESDPFLRPGFRVASASLRGKLNQIANDILSGMESARRFGTLPVEADYQPDPNRLAWHLFGVAAGSVLSRVSSVPETHEFSSKSFVTSLGRGFGAGYPNKRSSQRNAFLTGTGLYLAYWHWPQYIEEQSRLISHPAVDRGLGAMIWLGSGLDGMTAGSIAHSFASERRPEIWRGLGFAVTFLSELCEVKSISAIPPISGPMAPYLSQGVAFGAFQRARFQPVDEQVERICQEVSGESAAALVRGEQNTFSRWE